MFAGKLLSTIYLLIPKMLLDRQCSPDVVVVGTWQPVLVCHFSHPPIFYLTDISYSSFLSNLYESLHLGLNIKNLEYLLHLILLPSRERLFQLLSLFEPNCCTYIAKTIRPCGPLAVPYTV
jgi:hypothetical protein